MVFNGDFNNVSVIPLLSVLYWWSEPDDPEKAPFLLQVNVCLTYKQQYSKTTELVVSHPMFFKSEMKRFAYFNIVIFKNLTVLKWYVSVIYPEDASKRKIGQ